jgi:hypothetical protein
MQFDVHGISGVIAVVLMAVHDGCAQAAGRAVADQVSPVQRRRVGIWLIPYLSPLFLAMAAGPR